MPVVMPGLTYRDGSYEPPEVQSNGLSLRDYFAAAAMASIDSRTISIDPHLYGKEAHLCYAFADAMLAARTSTSPTQ